MNDTNRQPHKLKNPEEKKRYLPIPYEQLEEYARNSPIPKHLQNLTIFNYDTSKYPFREAIADLLKVQDDDLENLHCTEQGKLALEEEMSGAQHRKRGKQPHYIRLWTRAGQTGERDTFNQILDKFVAEFVARRMSSTHDKEDGDSTPPVAVAYQKDPTFRVVLPSGQQLGYRHCDADYHHPPAEINWWIPLTTVFDTNTLHTESLPGKGDFAPINLQYGQALRFYGNMCCHYTVPNVSDTCRVSFDMRVLSLDHHDPEWTDRLDRKCLFKVGQYYRIPKQLSD